MWSGWSGRYWWHGWYAIPIGCLDGLYGLVAPSGPGDLGGLCGLDCQGAFCDLFGLCCLDGLNDLDGMGDLSGLDGLGNLGALFLQIIGWHVLGCVLQGSSQCDYIFNIYHLKHQ